MCYNPIKVKYHDSFKNYRGVLIHPHNKARLVKCGKCLACREQYIESWQIRWREQLKASVPDSSYMITLTYNNENLPHIVTPDGEIKSTLNYPDVQKFLKRLRKKQDTYCKKNGIENPEIKYHGSGEYGTNFTKRPHYHILITNVIISPDLLESIWGNGKIHVGNDVTEQTISYVLKYTLKHVHSSKKPVKHQTKTVRKAEITPWPYMDHYYSPTSDPDFILNYGKLPHRDLYFVRELESNVVTHFKYHPKGTENEYRIAEKSFLSKGIGKTYLTEENINYHRENVTSTYDYFDVKKRTVKQRPLPRYYHEHIYNPIKQVNGKNQYVDKKPVRVYDKADYDLYVTSPLYKKQVIAYKHEQKLLLQMLQKYNGDVALMTATESATRRNKQKIARDHYKKVLEYQKYNNKLLNLVNS